MRARHIWPVLMLVAVACGGADETALVAGTSETPGTGEVTASASLPDECSLPPYDVQIRRAGDGENETFTVVDAEDIGFGAGNGQNLAYKAFATDFDLADDQDLISQIMPENIPDGSTVVNVELGRLNDSQNETPGNEYPDIVAGEELQSYRNASGPDAVLGVQVNILESTGPTSSFSVNTTASGTVLYADEDIFCIDVTIESQSGYQLDGIFTATVR